MDTAEHDPHRPTSVDEMACADLWRRLGAAIGPAAENPPHMIVAGAAGIGKSCALRACLRGRIAMWMRCSSDPTLRDNRERIKMTARGRGDGVRWIVLEHADMLHADAQAFLRRVIETSVGSTRFALEVRDLGGIAEPLLSRTVLFMASPPLPYEIRTEIQRRAPSTPLPVAERLAAQSRGNVRWAVLQALGGGDGMLAAAADAAAPISWPAVLERLEFLQKTGSAPHMWLGPTGECLDWERPGGACPWALTARALAATVTGGTAE